MQGSRKRFIWPKPYGGVVIVLSVGEGGFRVHLVVQTVEVTWVKTFMFRKCRGLIHTIRRSSFRALYLKVSVSCKNYDSGTSNTFSSSF